jgi:predicted bacteriocin transport accessory protein
MSRRKRNREMKPGFIIGIIIGIIILGVILIIINGNLAIGGSNNDASGDWKAALASNEKQLIYLGSPTCSWCNKIRPSLNNLVGKYNIKSTYINMSDIKQSDQNTIFQKLDLDPNNFGTPALIIIEDGKKIDSQIGYLPEDELYIFFEQNGLIK